MQEMEAVDRSHMLVDGPGNIYLVETKEETRKVGKNL
jgi:hypothetical protein